MMRFHLTYRRSLTAVGCVMVASCGSLLAQQLDPHLAPSPNLGVAQASSDPTLLEQLSPTRLVAYLKGEQPDQDAAREIFLQAEDQFRAAAASEGKSRVKAFEDAAKQFKRASLRGKGFPVEEDALWMVAESYFFADNYAKASEAYGKLIKHYPNTQHLDRVDERRFAIAQYWLKHPTEGMKNFVPNFSDERRPTMDTFGHAIKLFDRIRFDDPTGERADDATMAAAVANFTRGKYAKADELFTDLRENFPTSQHQFDAHLIGLKAKLMTYEGPDYDGGALTEAERIIRNAALMFPEKAQEHYEVLDKTYKEIRLQKAQRDYVLAQYYDRRKEYRAARMHYEIVKRDYSDTNLAVEAEARLAQIDGLPDIPKRSLEFLQNVFPDSPSRPEPLIRRSPTGAAKR